MMSLLLPPYYNKLYDVIQSRALERQKANSEFFIENTLLGLSWSSVQVKNKANDQGIGLCFSPSQSPRNLSWSGTLIGKPVEDVLPWLSSWENSEVVVALATANALINSGNAALNKSKKITEHLTHGISANLAVFAYFSEQLKGAKVAIIGRYPGLEVFSNSFDFTVIEQNPTSKDLPAVAANYVLPEADWVFITASALANKTLPHLLSLSQQAKTVLMGPSLPWLEDWADFGIDYLAGVAIENPLLLQQIIAQGGGTRIFEEATSYRLLALS